MNVRALLRETLGRAHYERMRKGMAPALDLPPWQGLSDRQREAYRSRFDYAIPMLTAVVMQLGREARDDLHAELLDQGALG